jgi:hypothetical protein
MRRDVIHHEYSKQRPPCTFLLQVLVLAVLLAVVLVMVGTSMIQVVLAFQSSVPYRYDHNRYLQINRIGSISKKHNIVSLYYNSYQYNDNNSHDESSSSTSETTVLRHRMYPIQVQDLEQVYIRSIPNSNLSCIQFIELCLHCLLYNDVPYPDAGIRFLLRISTPIWKQQIYQSIGYHNNNYGSISSNINTRRQSSSYSTISTPVQDIDMIVSTISNTITQPNNQFGILVGEGERYRITFPIEPLEYEIYNKNNDESSNGLLPATTTYVECQLRDYTTNQLLVMMGWQLQKDNNENHNFGSLSSSYMIDRVDWQDFREHFRPGIGREEWMRICG